MNEFSKTSEFTMLDSGSILNWHDERISKLEEQSASKQNQANFEDIVRFVTSKENIGLERKLRESYFWPEDKDHELNIKQTVFEKIMMQLCIGLAFLISIYCLVSGSILLFPIFLSVALLTAFYDWEKQRR